LHYNNRWLDYDYYQALVFAVRWQGITAQYKIGEQRTFLERN